MNRTLLIELKSKEVNVSLLSFTNKWNILYSKNFEYKKININNSDFFDMEWIKQMKKEISLIQNIEEIQNISLLINSKHLVLKSNILKISNQEDLTNLKQSLKKSLSTLNPSMNVLNITFNRIVDKDNQKVFFYTYEMIDSQYIKKIHSSFLEHNIEINTYVPLNKAIYQGIKFSLEKLSSTFFIEIDEDQLVLSYFKNSKPIYQVKKLFGLTSVYQNISNKMGIEIDIAKKLFDSFGYIPPEGIADIDNKIIYSKNDEFSNQLISFDKRDLSTYITESINGIFQLIYEDVNEYKKSSLNLIFSGKIINLKGFIEYSKTTLGIERINTIEKSLIGLKTNSEILVLGALNYLEKKMINKKMIEEINTYKPKNVLKLLKQKVIRFYNYI